jgi:hypothetical protein
MLTAQFPVGAESSIKRFHQMHLNFSAAKKKIHRNVALVLRPGFIYGGRVVLLGKMLWGRMLLWCD